MTPEMLDLARRAVACKGWRWMPGMLIHTGFRCVWVDDETFRSFDQNGNETYGSTDCLLPDLTDPATLGCVLALVREARGEVRISTAYDHIDEKWYCDGPHEYEGQMMIGVFAQGLTEAEALVAALEAAP